MHLMPTALFNFARRKKSSLPPALPRPIPTRRSRFGVVLAGAALAAILALPGHGANAQGWNNERWTGTWG
ncbi:MAG TPA: hypothetical protein DDZ22_11830, partial [Massilia sp.]|nr:hypothetical protein [Massilia sp.]